MGIGGWVSDLLGYVDIIDSLGNLYPRRKKIRFLSASIADNPASASTDVQVNGGERWTLGLDVVDQVYGTDLTDVIYYAAEPSASRVALIAEPTASNPRKMRIACGYAAGTHTVTPRTNAHGDTFSIAGRSIVVGPRSGDNPFVDLHYVNGIWRAVATAWNP